MYNRKRFAEMRTLIQEYNLLIHKKLFATQKYFIALSKKLDV